MQFCRYMKMLQLNSRIQLAMKLMNIKLVRYLNVHVFHQIWLTRNTLFLANM